MSLSPPALRRSISLPAPGSVHVPTYLFMVPIPPPFWAADARVPNLYRLPLGSWRAGVSPRRRMQAKKTSNVLSWLLESQLLKTQFVSNVNRIQSLARAGSEERIEREERGQKPAG